MLLNQEVVTLDGWELFLRHHAGTHSAEAADSEGVSLGDDPFQDLTDAQLRLRPHGLNSIAWLIWHIARCEDVVVNVLLADRPQVFDDGDWARRINAFRRDIGTGMTNEEVSELSAGVDIPSLRVYRVVVGKRTQAAIRSLQALKWDDVIETARVREAVSQGALGPNAGWMEGPWATKTKAWFFDWEVVGHNYFHLGQAMWVRKLVATNSP